MMEVALPVIGLLGQCYSGALQAYLWIQTAVDFPETAAKLVIQLEVERIRLQLWGRNSGADSDNLYPGLAPFEPLIIEILTKVKQLLCDSDKLKDSYGLTSTMDGDPHGSESEGRVEKRRLLTQVKGALRSALAFTAGEKGEKSGNIGGSATPLIPRAVDHEALARKTYERIRWVIVSKSRFESLISDLRHLTNNLNELLRESQFIHLSQEWHSIEMRTVARTEDQPALQILQEATEGDDNSLGIFSMARRKSIVMSTAGAGSSAGPLSKDDFDLPQNFATLSRSIAIYRPVGLPSEQKYVLIERKHYDSDISAEDKVKLLFRLHNLIALVNSPPSEFLSCMGYWSESQAHCWCLVYQFPLHSMIATPGKDLSIPLSPQPPSLLSFISSDDFRPPLEARVALACTLASVFSRFYGSKWLHKGVRSENIVFPLSDAGGVCAISRPIVAGFEYSRQYTEQATIDRATNTRAHAIYRHPRYQGPAASGYRMAYDIYSFGLVLVEIAWWVPLDRFGRVVKKGAPESSSARAAAHFGAEEAEELRRMVIKGVRKEMAFRMGSVYKAVVEWCLTRGDEGQTETDAELAVEFYTMVAVPLQNVSASTGR
ncbi:prion-inhibition and propagation-domain-containing protein [Mycena pura]|uniref:Prion-inhibition and propagation-domain-containing protein n=1 Tax=Mycena pura TaxID=153505 RepID=A0AAD6VT00_9AGAR|nr:prion-inhibition and propagation-domain-containing protein [Mycena pura]